MTQLEISILMLAAIFVFYFAATGYLAYRLFEKRGYNGKLGALIVVVSNIFFIPTGAILLILFFFFLKPAPEKGLQTENSLS